MIKAEWITVPSSSAIDMLSGINLTGGPASTNSVVLLPMFKSIVGGSFTNTMVISAYAMADNSPSFTVNATILTPDTGLDMLLKYLVPVSSAEKSCNAAGPVMFNDIPFVSMLTLSCGFTVK